MQSNFLNLKPSDCAKVTGYGQGDIIYRSKLLAMGLIPRVLFRVIRTATLGEPLEILVNGFHLSFRSKEADNLNIEMVKQWNQLRWQLREILIPVKQTCLIFWLVLDKKLETCQEWLWRKKRTYNISGEDVNIVIFPK